MNAPDTLDRHETLAAAAAEHRETARRALEEVCSGRDLAAVEDVYSDRFVDHVNALEYRGTEDARRSVALYLRLGVWRSLLLLLRHGRLLREQARAGASPS